MQEDCERPAGGSTDEQAADEKTAHDAHRTGADLPAPKRGAFPTPEAVIESAPHYIPESAEGDEPAAKLVLSAQADEEQP